MKLDFVPFDLQLNHTWAISRSVTTGGGSKVASVVLVRLKDNSAVGFGEAPTSKRYVQSADSIQDFLRLVDPNKLSFGDIPGSMAYLEKLAPGNSSAKCALNVALVDGAARLAGKPVYDLLGLGFTEKKHLTSLSIGIDTPEMIRRKVAEAASYPILKLKIGSPGDAKNLAALRAVDPKKIVRVDANEGWTTKEEALRNLEWLARDPHIEFVEQPMPASTPTHDLAWLKRRSPLPLFADESCQNVRDIPDCTQCYHGVNVKLIKTGGITGACETLQAARRAGLKTMLGCMIESSVLITAAAHLAELTNHLDIDGNLLISNDPFTGAAAEHGAVSFASATEKTGLRVKSRKMDPFGGGLSS
ncbi:MAG TPA: dipeptide epimerase [Verrucomicrobiae bacterium]|jgi:L-alanine-DL-glutamate epimerase-like enolase superfamily enzyme|nr:dipeptide epimerase [Verrucomicrobiae bacterium]